MKRSVELTGRAARDLSRLAAFLAAKSPEAAHRALDTIETALRTLQDHPERGMPRGRGGMRELFVSFGSSAYVIRYLISGETVIVGRIWHGREQRR